MSVRSGEGRWSRRRAASSDDRSSSNKSRSSSRSSSPVSHEELRQLQSQPRRQRGLGRPLGSNGSSDDGRGSGGNHTRPAARSLSNKHDMSGRVPHTTGVHDVHGEASDVINGNVHQHRSNDHNNPLHAHHARVHEAVQPHHPHSPRTRDSLTSSPCSGQGGVDAQTRVPSDTPSSHHLDPADHNSTDAAAAMVVKGGGTAVRRRLPRGRAQVGQCPHPAPAVAPWCVVPTRS